MVEFLELLMPKPRRRLPVTRGECAEGARPCPMVSCRHHLLLHVTSDRRLYSGFDFDEDDGDSIVAALEDMPQTCALDVADDGPHTLQEIADVLGISVVVADEWEQRASAKMRAALDDRQTKHALAVEAHWRRHGR